MNESTKFILAVIFSLVALSANFDTVISFGEPETIDLSEEHKDFLNLLAEKSVDALNAESSNPHHWKLERLLKATKQIVSGVKFNLKVLVTRSECSKQFDDEKILLNLCSVRDDAPKQVCQYEVTVREWEHSKEFLNLGCSQFLDNDENTDNFFGRSNRHPHQTRLLSNQVMRRRMAKAARNIRPYNQELWKKFAVFVDSHSKVYSSKHEIMHRFRVYKRNHIIAKMWQDNEKGTAVYGETQFMDLTQDEFRNIYLPYVWQKPTYRVHHLSGAENVFQFTKNEDLPIDMDWRKKGVVTEVKNQESCGSCWAFSVTGNIEGQWAIKKGKLISLSEQELVDCDVIDQGCNGGLPLNAYREIIRMGGLEPESEYPYDAHREQCHLVRKEIAVYINDSIQLPPDENKMAIWLFKNGPISIGVNALPLQFYRHGISHPWKIFCSPQLLNHGVLIVGYGVEGKKPFWIIKNSWGPKWGESGYYRLYRGKNVCGVHEMATSSIIN